MRNKILDKMNSCSKVTNKNVGKGRRIFCEI